MFLAGVLLFGGVGGGGGPVTIGSLFAGEVEIMDPIEAEVATDVDAEVETEVTAEVEVIVDAEVE